MEFNHKLKKESTNVPFQTEIKTHKIEYSSIPPIRDTIQPQKSAPRYSMHMYFTRRPFNVVREYIKHFSNPGDTVLDPYVGSGVTTVESLISRRKTIAIDLAPLACFITKSIVTAPIDIKKLQEEFNKIRDTCKSDIYEIFSRNQKEIENNFQKIIKERGLWYPTKISLPQTGSAQATKGYLYVEDIFTKKELLSLSILLKEIKKIKDKNIREMLMFVFSATLHYTNKTLRPEKTASSITSVYRYWVPDRVSEVNVWEYFERRFKHIVKGKTETNNLINGFYNNENCKIINGDATELKKYIPENSVDYIFTDPPYGANIAYLDLTTMWDAWLDFKISRKEKEKEVIEGGELGKSQQDYITLLIKSFREMFDVLKKDRWMSVVFHHKELKLWNAVVNGAREAGFEYINTVSQPSVVMPTFRKIQSPLRALAGELIINFRKSMREKVTVQPITTNLKGIVLNTAERLIIQKGGATTDEIYHAIIPEILDANLIDIAVKEVNDITPLLQKEFELDNKDKWQIKKDTKIGSWLPKKDRIKLYLTSILKREKEADVDKIISLLMPLLTNGHQPDNKEIMEVLEEIAEPSDGKWKLKVDKPRLKQTSFAGINGNLPSIKFGLENEKNNHTQMIFALANLGKKMGYKIWIGKKEQGQKYYNLKLNQICDYEELPILEMKREARRIIEQIDIIWFDKDQPTAGFEVENSTNVQTGIMRFVNLIKKEPLIASKLYILTPDIRKNKVEKELKNPAFIGEPLYLEKKIKYILYSDFIGLYNSLRKFSIINFKDLDNIARSILI